MNKQLNKHKSTKIQSNKKNEEEMIPNKIEHIKQQQGIENDDLVSDDSGLGNIFGKEKKKKTMVQSKSSNINKLKKPISKNKGEKNLKNEDDDSSEESEAYENSSNDDQREFTDEEEDLENIGNKPAITSKLKGKSKISKLNKVEKKPNAKDKLEKQAENSSEYEEGSVSLSDKEDQIDKNVEESEIDENDEDQELVETHHLNMNMEEINLKIKEIVNTLSDFKNKKELSKTRTDYTTELFDLCKIYYDYNDEIMTLIMNLFAPNEAVEFLEASNGQRVMTIRTNTLKTKRRELAKILINRGVNLDPLAEWTKVGLKIYDSEVPVGATPEYLAGQYMLQSGSSFVPVMALAPQENEKVLDMCAAPGGKTTYIAQLMKNTGVLVANDIRADRIKSLYFNVHRLGVKNCIITNYDGKKISEHFSSFDRVLLDAPCSGLGVISKDPSVKVNRTYKEIIENTRIQKELLLASIDCCNYKTGAGVIVYSTCSISVEENEWVVDYALQNRFVRLVAIDVEIGEEGLKTFRGKQFHPTMNLTKRIYPHIHNMDGFFVAKLQKYADGPKKVKQDIDIYKNEDESKQLNLDGIKNKNAKKENFVNNTTEGNNSNENNKQQKRLGDKNKFEKKRNSQNSNEKGHKYQLKTSDGDKNKAHGKKRENLGNSNSILKVEKITKEHSLKNAIKERKTSLVSQTSKGSKKSQASAVRSDEETRIDKIKVNIEVKNENMNSSVERKNKVKKNIQIKPKVTETMKNKDINGKSNGQLLSQKRQKGQS